MQFVRQKSTGRVGFIGVDPYCVCAEGEIPVSFAPATDPNRFLGNGCPRRDFKYIEEKKLSRYYRKKYGVR